MTTLIYCNTVTGEVFDADGVLRTENNPFTCVAGEKRDFEWHLVTETDRTNTKKPAQWTKHTFSSLPGIASIAVDDNYILAYKAVLSEELTGSVSRIRCTASAPQANVAPSGILRLPVSGGTMQEAAYTSRTVVPGGYEFTVSESFGSAVLSSGTEFHILETPLARAEMNVSQSDRANGVFAFTLNFGTWRVQENLGFSNKSYLETQGMELRVAESTESGTNELFRGMAPFRLNACLDSLPAGAGLSSAGVLEYQTWTSGLFAQGLKTEFSSDGSSWSSSAEGASYARIAYGWLSGAATAAIPLGIYVRDTVSFTVSSGNTDSEITVSAGTANISPLLCKVTDGGKIQLTNNPNLRMNFSSGTAVLRWIEAFPPGEYILG